MFNFFLMPAIKDKISFGDVRKMKYYCWVSVSFLLFRDPTYFIDFFVIFFYSAVSFYIWRHLFNHKKQPKKEKNIKEILFSSNVFFLLGLENKPVTSFLSILLS